MRHHFLGFETSLWPEPSAEEYKNVWRRLFVGGPVMMLYELRISKPLRVT
jgi:hypothetical protein